MERETKGFVNILSALISEEILQEIISQGEESTTLHEEKIVLSDKTCGCQQENEGIYCTYCCITSNVAVGTNNPFSGGCTGNSNKSNDSSEELSEHVRRYCRIL